MCTFETVLVLASDWWVDKWSIVLTVFPGVTTSGRSLIKITKNKGPSNEP